MASKKQVERCYKKKLVRLKKPRLPSALGLSGACGVVAYALASLSTHSDSPISPNPLSPSPFILLH
eukprot:scaffold11573_cov114-Isochrysis_galbana.AAC.1